MYVTGINRIRPKSRFTVFKSDYRQVLKHVDAIWSPLRVDTFLQKLQVVQPVGRVSVDSAAAAAEASECDGRIVAVKYECLRRVTQYDPLHQRALRALPGPGPAAETDFTHVVQKQHRALRIPANHGHHKSAITYITIFMYCVVLHRRRNGRRHTGR